MELEKLAIPPPWAQGVGRSNRPAPPRPYLNDSTVVDRFRLAPWLCQDCLKTPSVDVVFLGICQLASRSALVILPQYRNRISPPAELPVNGRPKQWGGLLWLSISFGNGKGRAPISTACRNRPDYPRAGTGEDWDLRLRSGPRSCHCGRGSRCGGRSKSSPPVLSTNSV